MRRARSMIQQVMGSANPAVVRALDRTHPNHTPAGSNVLFAPAEFGTFTGCGKLLQEVVAVIDAETTNIKLDCSGIQDANATFAAALVLLARRLRERGVSCTLIGLGSAPRHIIELHRLGPVLAACGVHIDDRNDPPPAARLALDAA